MAANPALSGALAQIKANPRLRAGLWLIAAIIWTYGLLLLQARVQADTEAYQALGKRIARMEAAAVESEWPERARAAAELRAALERELWREGTLGLAQASFQDWLRQAVDQAQLHRPTLTVAAQEQGNGGPAAAAWKVNAKLSFDFSQRTFYDFMRRISTSDRRVVVETLTVRGAGTPRAEMVLVAHFEKIPEAGAAVAR